MLFQEFKEFQVFQGLQPGSPGLDAEMFSRQGSIAFALRAASEPDQSDEVTNRCGKRITLKTD